MLCPQCGKEMGSNAVCLDCSAREKQTQATGGVDYPGIAASINGGAFPEHIATLPVNNKIKKAFTAFEAFNAYQAFGLTAALPKDQAAAFKKVPYKERYAVTKLLTTNIWWAFFFGGFYYIAKGMWRKGIVLLGAVFAIGLALTIGEELAGAEIPRSVDFGIGCGISYMISMTATYDLYRKLVKREVFWW